MGEVPLRDFIERIIKEHERRFEQRFEDSEKAVRAALIAAEKAVDKSEAAQAARNIMQNEFRDSLGDLSKLMWTTKEGSAALDSLRRELDIKLISLEEKVNNMAREASNLQGRLAMVGVIWGLIVLAASAVIKFWH